MHCCTVIISTVFSLLLHHSAVNIGPIYRRDVMRASIMLEKGKPEYATILAFDVRIDADARAYAEETGVRLFTADIIYHLFDQVSTLLLLVAATTAIQSVHTQVQLLLRICLYCGLLSSACCCRNSLNERVRSHSTHLIITAVY
jgi:hypothetical protein